jgi:hypothetical protein
MAAVEWNERSSMTCRTKWGCDYDPNGHGDLSSSGEMPPQAIPRAPPEVIVKGRLLKRLRAMWGEEQAG